jgi:predicted DCC family thiol-disulfide oxidoreductase YuxK
MPSACCAARGSSSCCGTTGAACSASPRSRGAAGRALLAKEGLPVDGLQTLLLVDGARTWQHTAAILRVLNGLGWPWRLAWLAAVVPAFLRDPAYRWVARHRYRLFGQSPTCLRPSSEHVARFLD